MTKCNMVFWMGFWKRREILDKSQGNMNKIWALVNNNNGSVLVH